MPEIDYDTVALCWFVLALGGYHMLAARRPLERHSIVGAVQAQRIAWMRNMAVRDNRTLDAILLQNLSQGNAFFASTSVIAIGGLAALMGTGDRLGLLLEKLPYVAHAPPSVWETKIALLMVIFIYAFFKFAWAFRLSHYTAIMIGATPLPEPSNASACDEHSALTARLLGIAAEHTNNGIRSFYYAIAALAWFIHPLLFMAATAWVLVILVRRDFFSRALRALAAARR
jgi:uncharacterized membrane protein